MEKEKAEFYSWLDLYVKNKYRTAAFYESAWIDLLNYNLFEGRYYELRPYFCNLGRPVTYRLSQ